MGISADTYYDDENMYTCTFRGKEHEVREIMGILENDMKLLDKFLYKREEEIRHLVEHVTK